MAVFFAPSVSLIHLLEKALSDGKPGPSTLTCLPFDSHPQDKAQAKKAILSEQNRISPLPTGVLTPPQSGKKQSSEQESV